MRSYSVPKSSTASIGPLTLHQQRGIVQHLNGGRRSPIPSLTPAPATSSTAPLSQRDLNQWIREGHTEVEFVEKQARKHAEMLSMENFVSLKTALKSWDPTIVADVATVGCGPAGLTLAAEVASRGLNVVLIGHDAPFVNNYGVWVDEFVSMGLQDTLDLTWEKAICYFGEEQEIPIPRAYGRVNLDKLRVLLIERCKTGNVAFHPGLVSKINAPHNQHEAELTCEDGSNIKTRMVTLASGVASGHFLEYEKEAPCPGAQTAYGIEVELEGYNDCYPPNQMLFMDYRRHHSGIWPGTASSIEKGLHPNGGDGLWDSHKEVPSFLYAMPLGKNRAFLEETCLVAKPALPFSTLRRRLLRSFSIRTPQLSSIVLGEWMRWD